MKNVPTMNDVIYKCNKFFLKISTVSTLKHALPNLIMEKIALNILLYSIIYSLAVPMNNEVILNDFLFSFIN